MANEKGFYQIESFDGVVVYFNVFLMVNKIVGNQRYKGLAPSFSKRQLRNLKVKSHIPCERNANWVVPTIQSKTATETDRKQVP